MTRKGDWIQTFSGRQMYPLDPRPEDIHVEDIAHALSNLCRFTGHVRKFYSVGEHSVRVSAACEDMRWGLLHDASEAYIGDMSRPLKRNMPEYKVVEKALMAVICERFDLPLEEPASVRIADNRMLYTEARDLMAHPPNDWTDPVEPYPFTIEPWLPEVAELRFLARTQTLGIL